LPEITQLPPVLLAFGDDFAAAMDAAVARGGEATRPPRARRVGSWPALFSDRRRPLWAAGVLTAMAALAIVLVVGVTGGGPTTAFAGWRAIPTTPTADQLQEASTTCAGRDPDVASLGPVVADTRGPFALLVYADSSGGATATTVCWSGLASADTVIEPGKAVVAVATVSGVLSPAAGSVIVDGQFGLEVTPSGAADFTVLTGVEGAGVSSVSLVLVDGSTVEATSSNGHFAAWWPSSEAAKSAEITTTAGTTTQVPISLPQIQYGSPPLATTGASGASGASTP
jgi:hypothetical protein